MVDAADLNTRARTLTPLTSQSGASHMTGPKSVLASIGKRGHFSKNPYSIPTNGLSFFFLNFVNRISWIGKLPWKDARKDALCKLATVFNLPKQVARSRISSSFTDFVHLPQFLPNSWVPIGMTESGHTSQHRTSHAEYGYLNRLLASDMGDGGSVRKVRSFSMVSGLRMKSMSRVLSDFVS